MLALGVAQPSRSEANDLQHSNAHNKTGENLISHAHLELPDERERKYQNREIKDGMKNCSRRTNRCLIRTFPGRCWCNENYRMVNVMATCEKSDTYPRDPPAYNDTHQSVTDKPESTLNAKYPLIEIEN